MEVNGKRKVVLEILVPAFFAVDRKPIIALLSAVREQDAIGYYADDPTRVVVVENGTMRLEKREGGE